MSTPLPIRPMGPLPLPVTRKGLPLPDQPYPRAQLRPQDLPAPRWHTFFIAQGYLNGFIQVLIDEIQRAEGFLDAPTKAQLREWGNWEWTPGVGWQKLEDAVGTLRAPTKAQHPDHPRYTALANLTTISQAKLYDPNYDAEGHLVSRTTVVNTSSMYDAEGHLFMQVPSRVDAFFSAEAQFRANEQPHSKPSYTAEATLANTSQAKGRAEFYGTGNLRQVPVSSLRAQWSSVGQLGTSGLYEIEILMEPNFSATGQMGQDTDVVDRSPGDSAAGTLSAPTRVNSFPEYDAAGQISAFTQVRDVPEFDSEGHLQIDISAQAVFPHFNPEGFLLALTQAQLSAAADSGEGNLLIPPVPSLRADDSGAGTLLIPRNSFNIQPIYYNVTASTNGLEIPVGTRYIDVICLGGGGGGAGGNQTGGQGKGGNGGNWSSNRLEIPAQNWDGYLNVVVGGGGGGGSRNNNGTGSQGGTTAAQVFNASNTVMMTVTATGGTGGSGINSLGDDSYKGKGPGNHSFQGFTYNGGATTSNNQEGNAPGGGGGGGEGSIWPGNGQQGRNGARGEIWIRLS